MSPPPDTGERPDYKVYRARPSLLRRRNGGDTGSGLRELRGRGPGPSERRRRGRLGPRQALKWVAFVLIAWVGVSLVLFMVSAQIEALRNRSDARDALDSAGYPLTAPNTILVLGSDARPEGSMEPGADVGGPSRSDSILLLRTGGGRSARLSIPRDTVVDIPGHGTDKVNAAYSIGGPGLAVSTIKQYLGIEINHVMEVNFENFPGLIDAMGGVDYTGGCVVSRINGGFRNGGYTLRLRAGTNRLDGRQALALARTRDNECNPDESDLSRARRQQKLFASIRDRMTSPGAFARLPWISWAAPRSIRSDMAGPGLIGTFAALTTAGSPTTRVLKPSGDVTLPDGGSGLSVSEEERRAQVRRFLAG
jgi:LCP family protein required for cell wall assembly